MALAVGGQALQLPRARIGYWWDGENGIHVELANITDEMLVVEL